MFCQKGTFLPQDYCLILASNSPRRRQLLALGGWRFSVRPAPIDESPHPEEEPRHYVLRMAEEKARAAADEEARDNLVIGADTIVVDMIPGLDRLEILGKPTNAEQAAAMLNRLRGRTHQVYTAVAVYRPSDGALFSRLCSTDVTMRDYTHREIENYVASGDPFDKAGAYAIQHAGFDPVESIRGCFANVVGLPLCSLNHCLAQAGLEPPLPTPQECDHTLCPFCLRIIEGLSE